LILSNTETKELKKRVRDIIEPGRDLGHVDGKKSLAGATASEHGHQGSKAHEDCDKSETQNQETDAHEKVRRPRAISKVQINSQESERKSTPMDVDGIDTKNGKRGIEVKRNLDGSICEDCN
jgi:hypothetical protein